jgi:hypothetical protein
MGKNELKIRYRFIDKSRNAIEWYWFCWETKIKEERSKNLGKNIPANIPAILGASPV